MTIHCILVDDHTLFRAGLRRLLESEPDFVVVGEASDAEEAMARVLDLKPDIVLMDIAMPGVSSFSAARLIRQRSPGTRVIFLTMYDDEEYLGQCRNAGAAGYLLKDTPASRLIQAIREIRQGREYFSPALANREEARRHSSGSGTDPSLTPREREVIKLIAEGHSVREIAERLHLSTKTVEAHKFNLMRKLDIHNKAHLVRYAIQKKIVRVAIGV